jgi:hypothetical protein
MKEHVLLVEPSYYTRYPPLGLLKISSYRKSLGNTTELIQVRNGFRPASKKPTRIFVTSLFTYAWRPVHDAVRYYRSKYPSAEITLGGIYASLMPEHAMSSGCDAIHNGLVSEAESLLPDYGLVPNWKASILFSSRGCVRKCPFCAVPILEPAFECRYSIGDLIYPGHRKLVLWDNNFLASRHWYSIMDEIRNLNLEVDFNQGLDARFMDEEKAEMIAGLRYSAIRMAFDDHRNKSLEKAISILREEGVRPRSIIVYALYNFKDTPETFLDRVRSILEWGATCYPMRYQPIDTLTKDSFVSSSWTEELLEMVADARRVIGYNGAFPPYSALVEKFSTAKNFRDAFSLRPPNRG